MSVVVVYGVCRGGGRKFRRGGRGKVGRGKREKSEETFHGPFVVMKLLDSASKSDVFVQLGGFFTHLIERYAFLLQGGENV